MSANTNNPGSSSGLSLTPPSPTGFVERGPDLPREYGVTRLVLLPRDPQWMQAYWEVAPYTWQEAERNFGGAIRTSGKPVLRLSASVNGARRSFDVGIQLDARNWYVFAPERGGQWSAELGLVLPDGRFVLLAISNEISLPVGHVSDQLDEKWAILKAEWDRLFELSGAGKLGVGSLDVARMLAQRWELYRAVSSWSTFPGVSSWAPGSSWAKPPESRPKGFWLVADTEVIVYGATEPDAKVKFQGQDVALNPDGTFSYRFALPDGKIDMPIEATNRDGDISKGISFTVTRSSARRD
jgi:hypothetical protein